MVRISRSYKVLAESPLDVIAFEEYLVNSMRAQSATLLVYVNPPSVIIGRNQNYWREVSPSCPLPVFRRVSGGGAVYHDEGNVNWALVLPRALHSQEDELALVARSLSDLGIHARPGERGGLFVAMADGETLGKISGTARRFGTHNVLHHGTLLVRADIGALKASLGGIRFFEDSSIASVPAYPVNLSRLNPAITIDDVIETLSRALAGASPEIIDLRRTRRAASAPSVDPDLAVGTEYSDLRAQFGAREWIVDRSPPFSFTVSVGKGRAVVRVQEGKIAAARPLDASDRPSAELASRIEACYSGIRFDFLVPESMEKEQVWMNAPC